MADVAVISSPYALVRRNILAKVAARRRLVMREEIRHPVEHCPVVAIAGGSAGLGRALAEVLLRRGLSVVLCARRERRLQEVVESLLALGPVDGVAGDIADPQFRHTWLSHVVRRFGRLDALVICASTLGDIPMPFLRDTHIVNLRTVFEVNAFAPVLLLQQALPLLAERPHSLCLAISSDAAVAGYPGWGVYGASKAALDLFTKTFARETDLDHMALYSVDPGDMDTELHRLADPDATADGLADPAEVAAVLAHLFDPVLTGAPFPHPSGTRLAVRGTALVPCEGGC
ncbi:SDR family NAD(P)-dependent oxidoreductase [Alicyclobacillus herbarius]|uniref:SDR family NAD(P)-dependent oxidoreductase n=1 Tax=Alicyclobacillus herbarius TaxID=122960 RepID=UPI0012DDD536|nr:SDR family NAD(P)-dependent oxidoreductase [Alicyclobacillus herbarius]